MVGGEPVDFFTSVREFEPGTTENKINNAAGSHSARDLNMEPSS